jgi:MoxR-like ATPase
MNKAEGPAVQPAVSRQVQFAKIGEFCDNVESSVGRVVKGQAGIVRHLMVALLVQGHVLLEGNPGTAKTLLVRTVGRLCSLDFKRIQFTPDLMPSDITGTSIFRPDRAEFEFRKGPVFTQLLLADEINRAPARTQAALLQAMQERIVTADGTDHLLSDIFCVIATQNPLESEGTYPLPEAELDRFLFKLNLNYPDAKSELEIMQQHGAPKSADELAALGSVELFSAMDLKVMRELIYQVQVNPNVSAYALNILRATREHAFLRAGASTRAGVMMLRAARAMAATNRRAFVIPDDVRELVVPALRHRIFRTPAAELEGVSTDTILEDIVSRIPAPR